MKRALVLSGGGAKGAFQAGAVDALVREMSFDFEVLAGVSVGALNAAFLAQAPSTKLPQTVKGLSKLWLGIQGNHDVYTTSWWRKLMFVLGREPSLYDATPLRQLVQKHMNLLKLGGSSRKLYMGAVVLETGEYRSLEPDGHVVDQILASASLPLFFPPVRYGNCHWYDGGLRNITPLAEVFQDKPKEIVVVVTSPLSETTRFKTFEGAGMLELAGRSLEILTHEIFLNDLQLAQQRNNIAKAGNTDWHYAPIKIVAPKESLELDTLDFSPEALRRLYTAGQGAARAAFLGSSS